MKNSDTSSKQQVVYEPDELAPDELSSLAGGFGIPNINGPFKDAGEHFANFLKNENWSAPGNRGMPTIPSPENQAMPVPNRLPR